MVALAGQHRVEIPITTRDENESLGIVQELLFVEPRVETSENIAQNRLIDDHRLCDAREIGTETCQLRMSGRRDI